MSENKKDIIKNIDDIINHIISINISEDLNFYEYKECVKRLEELLANLKEGSMDYDFLKATIEFIYGRYDEYCINIESYIKKYVNNKNLFSFEDAYFKFFNIIKNLYRIDNINKKDQSKEYFIVLEKIQQILKKYCPDSAFELYVKYLLCDTENTNTWEKQLLRVLSKDDKWAVAYELLGNIYYNASYKRLDFKKAINYYEKAIELSDIFKTDEMYFNLAWSYDEIKDYVKSEMYLRKCLEITPDYTYANNNLGYSLYCQKKYEEALIYYDKSIALSTDDFLSYRNKFDVLKILERYEDMIELVKRNPEHFKTVYYMREVEKIHSKHNHIFEESVEKTHSKHNYIFEKSNDNRTFKNPNGSDVLEKSNVIDDNLIFEKLKDSTEYDFAGKINVASTMSRIDLYPHQQEAIRKMDKVILNADTYSGLLVLPTGGGKTLTATYWLMASLLDKGKKILWLAHRHELLNQAQKSFEKVCYMDITRNKPSYNWRIISGKHDRPINIKPEDDIIIAGKTSLRRGINYFLENWLKKNKDNIFLIIDEAHHATASEYKEIINMIKSKTKNFKMLGLTATPFRTEDSEQGLLKKIFTDDIVYKIDLRELINRGILSEPIFKTVSTHINMEEIFLDNNSESQFERIAKDNFFDIGSIGEDIANAIATNSKRNNAIVNEYVKNKHIYKQTIVFALNVNMAVALNSLFKACGISSDYIVSNFTNSENFLKKDNGEKIEAFRNGKLDVLVNVNILTEGTDLPKVQSVFLTRPTKSTILMTQMIGRALRGEQAGGTKEAYIVSFIDDWQDKIAWVNPEQLFIDENVDFTKKDHQTQKMAMRLVSIAKIEEFAKIVNGTIDQRQMDLDFIERIPIGIYKFSYLIYDKNDEAYEKHCNILVYDCMEKAYKDLFEWLIYTDLSNVDSVLRHIDETLFNEEVMLLGYDHEDIKDIIMFYKQTNEIPKMIYLSERKDYDITTVAKYITNNELSPSYKKEYIESQWERSDKHWSAFFGSENQKAFRKLIDDAIDRIQNPKDYEKPKIKPMTEKEKVLIEKLSLYEIRKKYPELEEKIRNGVYSKFTDDDGFYFSAQSGFRSKNKLDFQIDHIKPMAHGGITTLDNLQLLTRAENMIKADKIHL